MKTRLGIPAVQDGDVRDRETLPVPEAKETRVPDVKETQSRPAMERCNSGLLVSAQERSGRKSARYRLVRPGHDDHVELEPDQTNGGRERKSQEFPTARFSAQELPTRDTAAPANRRDRKRRRTA